ncbi:hypothetical protein KKC67_00635 [Patescibacteria group bacterium]|nr:hypothetical protein [Patescibacteria group bacterium]
METKNEIFDRYKKEYYKSKKKKSGKGDKKKLTEIIDIILDVTKISRKSIIRKFNNLQKKDPCSEEKRGRKLYYTPDITVALKDVWEAGDEVCGELLYHF